MANWNGSYPFNGQNYYYNYPYANTPAYPPPNWYYQGMVPNQQMSQMFSTPPPNMYRTPPPSQNYYEGNQPQPAPNHRQGAPAVQYGDSGGYVSVGNKVEKPAGNMGNVYQNNYIPKPKQQEVLQANTNAYVNQMAHFSNIPNVDVNQVVPGTIYSNEFVNSSTSRAGTADFSVVSREAATNSHRPAMEAAPQPQIPITPQVQQQEYQPASNTNTNPGFKRGPPRRNNMGERFKRENNNTSSSNTGIQKPPPVQDNNRAANRYHEERKLPLMKTPRERFVPRNIEFTPSELEEDKNQGRKKLLAEAAAFMTSMNQELEAQKQIASVEPSASSNSSASPTSPDVSRVVSSGSPTAAATTTTTTSTTNWCDEDPTQNNTTNIKIMQKSDTAPRDLQRTDNRGNRIFTNSKFNKPPPRTFQDNRREKKNQSDNNEYFNVTQIYTRDYAREKGRNNVPDFGNRNWQGGKKENEKSNNNKYATKSPSPKKEVVQDDDTSQRERLVDQLARGAYECMVCCERVRQHDPIWSCSNCYHMFHLKCIKRWAKSSKAGT